MSYELDIEMLVGMAQLSLPHSRPLEYRHLLHKHATQTKHFDGECKQENFLVVPEDFFYGLKIQQCLI
jgi:hypothetical protein